MSDIDLSECVNYQLTIARIAAKVDERVAWNDSARDFKIPKCKRRSHVKTDAFNSWVERRKKAVILSINGVYSIHESLDAAAHFADVSRSKLYEVLNGKIRQTKGITVKYAE